MAIQEKHFNILIESSKQDEKSRVMDELQKLGIGIKDGRINLLVIDYRSKAGKIRSELLEIDRFSIKNIVEEVIHLHNHNAINYYDYNDRMIVILWSEDNEAEEEVIRRLNEEITTCLKQYLHLEIFTGAVCGVENLMDLNQAYERALRHLECKVYPSSEMICFDGYMGRTGNFYDVIKGYKVEIQSGTEFCQYYKVSVAVKELFELLVSNDVSVDHYKFAYQQLIIETIDYFDNKSIDVFNSVDKETFIKPFDAFWELASLENYVSKTFFNICKLISKKRESMTNLKLIDQIIEYLYEHYSENINLNSVAANFEKTSSYISTLFKREINKNFLGYLTDLRMEKAKELLMDVTMKIGDVAELVGYVNPKHFNVVFKKNVGMTPKVYRNRRLS